MARLKEWKGRVAECQSNGQSVRAWCRNRGLRQDILLILSEAGRQMGLLGNGAGRSFVEMPTLPERTDFMDTKSALVTKLRIGGRELFRSLPQATESQNLRNASVSRFRGSCRFKILSSEILFGNPPEFSITSRSQYQRTNTLSPN